MRNIWMPAGVTAAMMLVTGCEPADERLAGYAERSVATQERQNEAIVRQSEKVVEESHELAEAAKEIVAADAQARQDIIAAQREANQGIHAERTSVDQQRESLADERREVAEERKREPIIAAVLSTFGALLVCLVPLAIAAYALRQMNKTVDDGVELGNLLVDEFTSDKPCLLPPAPSPPVAHRADAGPCLNLPSPDDIATSAPPF